MNRVNHFLGMAALVLAAVLLSCNPEIKTQTANPENNTPTAPEEAPAHRPMPNVDSLVRTCPLMVSVNSSSTVELAPGVNQTTMNVTIPSSLAGESGNLDENIYIVSIDSKARDLKIRTVAADNTLEIVDGKWKCQTLSSMAAAVEKSGEEVVTMINADFWSSPLAPVGVLHTEGSILKSTFEPRYKKQGISYVGVYVDNKMSIGTSAQYPRISSTFPNITGGGIILVSGGSDVDNSKDRDLERHPRTAVGYTKDQFIYFFVVDGRSTESRGMSMDDMGAIFASLKCHGALNLDGGGSSQMLSRDPSDGTLKIVNKPSDGRERAVIDAWCVVKKQTL